MKFAAFRDSLVWFWSVLL